MIAETDWRTAIERQRRRKDEYLADHPRSPLPADEREGFEGLSYYPIDPAYRFVVEFDEYDEKDPLTVETSTGEQRRYYRWGRFTVEVADETVTIEAYRADPDDDGLWVPFRDATSGDETYGAGRYLDLEPDRHRTDAGEWVLDFNEAYNPTCAYADGYSCPLPPSDNWLDVPIEAGERVDH